MNKFTCALALGAGLALGLAAPTARADAIQNLVPSTMSASTFNQDFQATTGVLTNSYTFMNTPTTGVVESQVFQGVGQYANFTAYAYQFGVNNVTDSTGQSTYVNSASMQFNAPPTPTSINGANSPVYVVTDGQVGGLNIPKAAPGAVVQVPASIAFNPGTSTATGTGSGSLTFQYLDPKNNSSPLQAGATSGTIVVITQDKNITTPFVSIQNPNPQINGYPMAFAPANPNQSPSGFETPEPATVIGWASVLGALALVRRVRRNRPAA